MVFLQRAVLMIIYLRFSRGDVHYLEAGPEGSYIYLSVPGTFDVPDVIACQLACGRVVRSPFAVAEMGEAAPEASEPEGAVRSGRAAYHDVGKKFAGILPDACALPGFGIIADDAIAVGAEPEDSGAVFQD